MVSHTKLVSADVVATERVDDKCYWQSKCSSNPCYNRGICSDKLNTVLGYECSCPPGK